LFLDELNTFFTFYKQKGVFLIKKERISIAITIKEGAKMEKLIEKILEVSDGFKVYGVGGFVRDLLIKRKLTDIDLAVNKEAFGYSKSVSKRLKAKLICLEKDKTYRLIIRNAPVDNIDISLLDGKTIRADLKKRDFTINAMAFNLLDFGDFKNHLIVADKACLKDLKNKSINAVSDKTFKQDPLRMLRAFRFAAELGFKIAPKTLRLIKAHSALIKKSAPERIKVEFFRILDIDFCAHLIKQMEQSGLLEALFPEIEKMKMSPKRFYYHPKGLFQHSFETLTALEKIISALKKHFPSNFEDLLARLKDNSGFSAYVTRVGLMKFSALFHDNAKPETAFKDGKKVRFWGHDEMGADKVKDILRGISMSKRDIRFASNLILNHMRPSNLTKNDIVTKRARLKFFREIAENTPEQIILSMADWHSYKSLKVHSQRELKNQEKTIREMIADYYELKNQKVLPKLIDGHLLMKEFGLKPGPWLGDMLDLVKNAQKEGSISDEKGALSLVALNLTPILEKHKIAPY
jgi:poly(A) polymerase